LKKKEKNESLHTLTRRGGRRNNQKPGLRKKTERQPEPLPTTCKTVPLNILLFLGWRGNENMWQGSVT